MESIKVFNRFQNEKYKIVYQILYTYGVTRVLLFLNKLKKSNDEFNYDIFFKLLYPTGKMRDNISFCFETINNSLDKDHILSRRDSELFNENDSTYLLKGEESEESFSKLIQDEEKEGLILNESKEKITPMDLSMVYKKDEDKNPIPIKKETIKYTSKKIIKQKKDFDYIWVPSSSTGSGHGGRC